MTTRDSPAPERSFFIEKRQIKDLSDLLYVARAIGKKVFHVERVNVKPEIGYFPHGYVVFVSPQHNGEDKLHAH